jgi:hypothetical protein
MSANSVSASGPVLPSTAPVVGSMGTATTNQGKPGMMNTVKGFLGLGGARRGRKASRRSSRRRGRKATRRGRKMTRGGGRR